MTDKTFTPPTTFPARYRTRGGGTAVILSDMGHNPEPLVGVMDGLRGAYSWHQSGAFNLPQQHGCDLIGAPLPDEEEPEEVILWGNGYECGDDTIMIPNFYATREAAEAARSAGEIRRGIYRIKAERFAAKGGNT